MEQAPLFYTQAPRSYQQNPQRKRLNHVSVVRQDPFFWQKGPSFFVAIDNIVYGAPGEPNSTHPGWLDLISDIPRLPQEEHVYKKKGGVSGFKWLMRPEQKSTMWMKDIAQTSGKLVFDACSGNFSVTKACVFLPKYRRLRGCEVDLSGVTDAKPQLILLYPRPVLTKE